MSFYLSTEMTVPASQSKYLARDASNYMLREIQGVAGTTRFPSYCFRGDNKTGMYWMSQGLIGLSSGGWTMFSFGKDTLSFFDRSNRQLKLTFEPLTEEVTTLKFPVTNQNNEFIATDKTVRQAIESKIQGNKINHTGSTIYKGYVVGFDVTLEYNDGFKLALADTEDNYGIGILLTDTDDNVQGTILHTGPMFLDDWTDIVGTEELTIGARYYLSDVDPGKLVTVSPENSQLIGIGLYANTLLLKI